MRLKFMTLLVLLVLSICVSVTVLRFGVGVLQDNFIAQLSTNYRNSSEFMALYGLLNFYVYTMAYVYSPSSNAILGKELFGLVLLSLFQSVNNIPFFIIRTPNNEGQPRFFHGE